MSIPDPERLIKLETQMENLKDTVEAGFKSSAERHADLKKMMTDFIEKSEDKFASKWVEDGLKWGITLVLGVVILALLYLIFPK